MPTAEDIPSPEPLIELIDVAIPSLQSATRPALEGVNWRVNEGDFWAIAGLARSGKTNLLMVAAGALRPMRGQCRLFGREYSAGFEQEQLRERLKVGLVFDGGQLLHHLTLAENVALPLSYHGDELDEAGEKAAQARLEALIEFTGLPRSANSRPAEVNRNWQQRFGLARALALKPRVLLLDNPLSGLDPRDQGWWLETVDALVAGHELLGQPVTLAVTGDDLRPWRPRARQFGVVSEGAFISVGGPDEVDLHPEPLLRELLPSSGAK